MRFTFWGGTDRKFKTVNYLISHDDAVTIYAECKIPEEIGEKESVDYGYVTMKKAILSAMEKEGMKTENIEWYYENDDILSAEAFADCEVYVDIES